MKRYTILISMLIVGLASSFGQSVKIIDDIYITPNEAQILEATKQAKQEKADALRKASYKNGAKQIVFLDENGNPTTAVPDTVVILDNSFGEDNEYVNEDGTYLHEFNGTKSDYEYAQRIKRFHNPRFTITIADPGYNDIYFLDDNYWNVSVDGIYATITPTWNNPAWWDYRYSPYSYNSWAWRYNWGYPYNSYWGLGFYRPYYMWDSWYGGLGGYYGWNNPYYYGFGGYYGWYDSYYNGYYDGFYSPRRLNQVYNTGNRRGVNRGVYNGVATTDNRRVANSRQSALNATGRNYTTIGRQSSVYGRSRENDNLSSRSSRSGFSTSSRSSVYSGNVNTRTRTGTVRSSRDWNNSRGTYTNSRSSSNSVLTNRTGVYSGSERSGYSRSSRSSSNYYGNTYNSRSGNSDAYRTSRSSGSYSGGASSSRSSSSYSGSRSGSSRSSGSYSGGAGSSRSSGSARSSRR